MLQRITLTLLLSGWVSCLAAADEPQQQRFVKDASQFCFPKLSADEQIKYYSNIVNIGASYTHGCMGCDQNDTSRAYTDLTADSLWFRRNYLVHFLSSVQWKMPGYGITEKIAILENDPRNRPKGLIPEWSLKRDGYTGEWIFDPRRDSAHLTDPEFSSWLQRNTGYGTAIAKVGGIERVTDLGSARRGERKGSLYQTFQTGQTQWQNAPRVFDLAIDGGRMHDFFSAYVSPDIIEPLQKSKWSNTTLRRRAVEEAIKYIKAFNPSMVMAIDALFWDSVSHALSFMRDSRPKSFLVRTVLNFMALQDKNGMTFNETRRFNVSEDFYKVIEGVSTNNQYGPAVPVLFARLADNPLEVFAQKNYEPVLAAVFGQYFETMTGKNFAEQIATWLRRIAYSENNKIKLNGVAKDGNPDVTSESLANRRVARTSGYYDEELDTYFSASEVEALRSVYESYERQIIHTSSDKGTLRTAAFGGKASASQKAEFSASPAFMSSITSWLILKAIKELPLFMESLEKAMQFENRSARAFASRTNNNTHLLNVDKFYESFPYFLKPEIMHPSVFGSKQMAGMINKAICYSTGAQ